MVHDEVRPIVVGDVERQSLLRRFGIEMCTDDDNGCPWIDAVTMHVVYIWLLDCKTLSNASLCILTGWTNNLVAKLNNIRSIARGRNIANEDHAALSVSK